MVIPVTRKTYSGGDSDVTFTKAPSNLVYCSTHKKPMIVTPPLNSAIPEDPPHKENKKSKV